MRWKMRVVLVGVAMAVCVGAVSSTTQRGVTADRSPSDRVGKGGRDALPDQSRPCRWRVVRTPNPGPGEHRLVAVSARSNQDVWALGDYFSGREGGPAGSFILHWNGVAWRVVPNPELPSYAELQGVAAVAADDAWSVGSGNRRPVIEHWDGRRWRRMPSPATGGRYSNLFAVTALSPRDVWAVGGRVVGRAGKALIEHWDGTRWRIVPSPSPPPRPLTGRAYDSLDAVAARSRSDVWAVGEATNVAPAGTSNTLVEHWDGKRWAVVPSPDVRAASGRPYNHLFSVAVTAPHDAWAVGAWDAGIGVGGRGDHALIERWNGHRWANVSPSFGGRARSYLLAVTSRSANDLWAMGDRRLQPRSVLMAHWDGSRWNTGPSLNGSLAAATTLRSGDVWAVGSTGSHPRTLAMHCRLVPAHGSGGAALVRLASRVLLR